MRVHFLAAAVLVVLSTGCSKDSSNGSQASLAGVPGAGAEVGLLSASKAASIASLPDRGSLVEYRNGATHTVGATVYPIGISEAHARRAIAAGGMVFRDPDGKPIPLKFGAQVAHADGNWTWVGQPMGASGSAVITFGRGAVFGSIPRVGAEPLQITMAGGRPVVVVPDANSLLRSGETSSEPDFIQAGGSRPAASARAGIRPSVQARASGAHIAQSAVAAATPASRTVDLVLGYTRGFATRLGGSAQAATRLHYLVDLGNQAYVDSGVNARLRLVGTVQVDYPDASSNTNALFQLSGLSCTASANSLLRTPSQGEDCTAASVPAALQPLVAARTRYGADLVSLVRNYSSPENGSCGVAWLIGAGQVPVTRASARYGVSIVSDSGGTQFPSNSSTCREEYLVHELGHNMGLQHDVSSAAGTDDTDGDGNPLDPVEFGAYADAFGYRTNAANGNFYTIMALRSAGQVGYRVFANPAISTCGGFPCGVVGEADNARVLGLTVPIVASFGTAVRTSVRLRGDFNGDHKSDILWRNTVTGKNAIWLSGNRTTMQAVESVDAAWVVAAVGDFNADGRSDIVWRNPITGANVLWPSGIRTGRQTLATVPVAWDVSATADFTGDGRADLLWRNGTTGENVIWPSGNRAQRQVIAPVADTTWAVAAGADFNGDGRADILWRNGVTGANVKWPAAQRTSRVVLAPAEVSWSVAAAADFNGDGRHDLMWRNGTTGANSIWLSADRTTRQAVSSVLDTNWDVAGAGDFDNDGRGDVLWRNDETGANSIWRSANQATKQVVTAVTDLYWIVAG
jgi:peptidyl-Asp metalloendopeptidase